MRRSPIENIFDLIDKISIPLIIVAVVLVVLVLSADKLQAHKKKKLKELKKAPAAKAHGVIFGKLGRKVVFSPASAEGSIGVFLLLELVKRQR